MTSNREEQVEYAQPQDTLSRREVATACTVSLKLSIPTLLDTMDNVADALYNGWPERLYVLSCAGSILYKGGKGPFGFDTEELAAFLAEHIIQSE